MTVFRFHIQNVTPTNNDLISHDLTELILIDKGEGWHQTELVERPIRAGNVFVVNGNIAHRLVDGGGLCGYTVMFDPARFVELKHDLTSLPGYHALFTIEPLTLQNGEIIPPLLLPESTLRTATNIVNEMQDEYKRQTPGFQTIITAYFLQLSVYLSRQYIHSETTDQIWRLARVMEHIEMHYRENITLEELASIANMSINHFMRIFKKLFMLSPIEYVIHLRLRKACELMQETDMAINRIATQVGFSDGNYFARQFRKVMGRTPREFRREIQSVVLD
jgi:AraC-like DNA-binding protein